MLSQLSATPYWWTDYFCLLQVSMDTCKDVDLDVLQAVINLSRRDKFLCDRASRRVAMKRLYQRHPVDTLCQEGVSKCNGVLGATFILFFILYRICSKQSRVQADRIKICNRAAVVRAVKSLKPNTDCAATEDHVTILCDKAACESKVITTSRCSTMPCHKACLSSTVAGSCIETVVMIVEVNSIGTYLLAIIRQHLLMSGDVELNPGPLDGE